MWRNGPSNPQGLLARNPDLHIINGLYTGVLLLAVGSVGKTGQVEDETHPISNSPDLHSCVLEISAHDQHLSGKQDRQVIHFSGVNYGYYCF